MSWTQSEIRQATLASAAMDRKENSQSVANTILAQLGGKRFIAMTGARNFVSDTDLLRFHLPRANKKIKIVQIKLNANDLYDIEFAKIVKLEYVVIEKHNDVFVENVREVFETATGLYTSL